MLKRKYLVLLLLTSVPIMLGILFYSNLVQANPTVKGYISIPPTAFTPEDDDTSFVHRYFVLRGDSSGTKKYWAPVQVPHGATLTNITVYLVDWVSDGAVTVALWGWDLPKNMSLSQPMASVETSQAGTPGEVVLYDDTIDDAKIDNKNCMYSLEANFTKLAYPWEEALLELRGVLIEYEYEAGAVGGFWIPVDKFSLLTPYIALVITIILAVSASAAYIKYRKKQ